MHYASGTHVCTPGQAIDGVYEAHTMFCAGHEPSTYSWLQLDLGNAYGIAEGQAYSSFVYWFR